MTEETTPAQNKTDAVDVRASELAKREGRVEISDADRKRAFDEMQKTAPKVEKSPNDD